MLSIIYIKKKNYIFQVGDVITLTVKEALGLENIILQKENKITQEQESVTMRFDSIDTDLEPGEYYYDIRIDYANGDISTVIYPPQDLTQHESNFFILGVVNDG